MTLLGAASPLCGQADMLGQGKGSQSWAAVLLTKGQQNNTRHSSVSVIAAYGGTRGVLAPSEIQARHLDKLRMKGRGLGGRGMNWGSKPALSQGLCTPEHLLAGAALNLLGVS
jgi:hypothetical protein